MEHHFNHRAESFDSPKNQFLADLVNVEIKQQVSDLSTKSILDFGGGTGLIADYTVPDGENHGFIISELEETLKNHGFSDIQTQILYSSDHLFLDKPSQLFLTSAIR